MSSLSGLHTAKVCKLVLANLKKLANLADVVQWPVALTKSCCLCRGPPGCMLSPEKKQKALIEIRFGRNRISWSVCLFTLQTKRPTDLDNSELRIP